MNKQKRSNMFGYDKVSKRCEENTDEGEISTEIPDIATTEKPTTTTEQGVGMINVNVYVGFIGFYKDK